MYYLFDFLREKNMMNLSS